MDAVTRYGRRPGRILPAGAVPAGLAAQRALGGSALFCLEVTMRGEASAMAPADRQRRLTLDLTDEDLTAALLGYCRSLRIPISRRAAKSLQMFGSRLGLVLTIGNLGRV